ncbi:uncharacterized protein LOC111696554 isoform X2 [Eurytemora carolleeae]|uniref:uncharacterized protein LOC111696554 isoform X2 n=1 Tax=Eurytemora carolleeae TaxID=1294199 RepID=UPI000C77D3A5|nr:uncharacterized protein LOC111696554 isoform X2 [Eurytemora carolleeae]|eukprot:XP_023321954.1 uncharacterized protein LOC111696554 isoform X2 [Eurytemora affinis]
MEEPPLPLQDKQYQNRPNREAVMNSWFIKTTLPKFTDFLQHKRKFKRSKIKEIMKMRKLTNYLTGPNSPVFIYNHGKFKQPELEEVKEYCAESSIHGLKYITEDGVSWIQRVLWIVWFILALVCLILLFKPIMDKYNNTPTITTVETTNYPISNIDFPGVTVCSNIRVSLRSLLEATQKPPWNKYNTTLKNQMILSLLKYNTDPHLLRATDHEMMEKEEKFVRNLMYQITPSCERMFLFCKWQGKRQECKKFVTMTNTDAGFCCSINTVNLADSFTKDENKTEDEYMTTVRPSANCNTSSINGDESGSGNGTGSGSNSSCLENSMSSSGLETPNDPLRFTGILTGYENHITNECQVRPGARIKETGSTGAETVKTGAETAKDLEANSDFSENVEEEEDFKVLKTNMVAQDLGFSFLIDGNFDDKVSFGKTSTNNNFFYGLEANCLLECTVGAMLQLCGCVPYFYPDFPKSFIEKHIKLSNYTNSTGFCFWDNLKCLSENRGYLNAFATPGTEETDQGLHCNCPDDCNQVVYSKGLVRKAVCKELYQTVCEEVGFKQEFDALAEYAIKLEEMFGKYETFPGQYWGCAVRTFKEKIMYTAYIHVFFSDMGVTKFKRDQLFGWQDIVAQFGGTVGLCVGLSILSVCEIFYFLLCRRWLKK